MRSCSHQRDTWEAPGHVNDPPALLADSFCELQRPQMPSSQTRAFRGHI